MKHVLWMFPLVAVLALVVGCGGGDSDVEFKKVAGQPAGPADPGAAAGADTPTPKGITGKVVETMNAKQYTYVLVDTGKAKVWAAGPTTAVAVGEDVSLPPGNLMTGFHSSSLDRTFEQIYFVQWIKGGAKGGSPHAGMGGMGGMGSKKGMDDMVAAVHGKRSPAATLDFTGLKKAEGGLSIEEVFGKKADLSGKEVKIRAKVAKFTPRVMGKNWIHLRDGTGGDGTNDLTVNTATEAKVGDTVLVTGKITLEKDFGFGYKYAVIIEDAKVVVE